MYCCCVTKAAVGHCVRGSSWRGSSCYQEQSESRRWTSCASPTDRPSWGARHGPGATSRRSCRSCSQAPFPGMRSRHSAMPTRRTARARAAQGRCRSPAPSEASQRAIQRATCGESRGWGRGSRQNQRRGQTATWMASCGPTGIATTCLSSGP